MQYGNRKSLWVWGVAASAIAAMGAGEAVAQDALEDSGATADASDTDTAMSVDDEIIDDNMIIVTAQKRGQNLQDVPLAVSAVTEDTLQITGTTDVQSLSRIVPNLSFGDSVYSRSRANFIRGLGTQSLSDGVETGVGTFVDGVILGRDFQGFGAFNDLQRVEVLRGPQGTLFGKNSSAGVIHLITIDPTYDYGGKFAVSYGSDDEVIANATLNAPIVDGVAALRIGGYYNGHDGFVDNPVLGRDVNENEGFGFRAKLLFEPTDSVMIRLSADYQASDELCCDFTFRTAPPPAADNPTPFLTAFGALTLAGQDTDLIGVNSRTSFANTPTGEDVENYGFSGQVDWDLGPVKLVSITAYREGSIFEFNGADYTPLTVLDVASTDSDTEQFTQELRVESNDSASDLQYVAGFYFFDQTVDSVQRFEGVDLITFGLASAGIVPFPPGLPPQEQTTLHGAEYDNWALFGQATYSIFDSLRVTGGIRYTNDEVTGFVDRDSDILFNVPGVGLIPIFGDGSFIGETDNEEVSGKAVLEYDITEDILVYGSWTRGYKGPAIQVDPLFGAGTTLPIVDPEIPTAFEVGVRSQFFDRRVTLNATLFRTDVDDYQAAAFDPEALSFLLQNVGDVRTQGIELEWSILPIDNLTLSGNLSVLDGEIQSFDGASCFPGQTEAEGCIDGTQDLAGGDLPFAPDVSFYLGADYVRDLTADLSGSIHVGYAFRDDVQFSLNNNPDTVEDEYGLLDANIRLTWRDRYSVDLFGQNLLDEDYASFIASAPVYSSFFGDPSTAQIPTRGAVVGVRFSGEF
ncbi:MAG: TonB-dependent receptor [Pseudomonadota bacterium]